MSAAPYGTWASPLTADAIAKDEIHIVDVLVDRLTSDIYHIETRPSEGGRNVLIDTATNTEIVERKWDVRTMVQEYGGAPATVYGGVVYFSHKIDGRVYRLDLKEKGAPEPVTPSDKPYRFACLEPLSSHPHLLIAVLEDHTHDIPSEVVTTLVTIDTDLKTLRTLLAGSDFYAMPKVSPNCKRIAWLQWFHPDMPWQGAEIYVGNIAVDRGGVVNVLDVIHVAGKRGAISAMYPTWANDERLIFTSDESEFINPYKFEDGCISPLFPDVIAQDFGLCYWTLDLSPYAILDKEGNEGLFSAVEAGRSVFYLVNLSGRYQPELIENSEFVDVEIIRSLSGNHNRQAIFFGKKVDEEQSIVEFTGKSQPLFTVLRAASSLKVSGGPLPRSIISVPQPITLGVGSTGAPLHVVYYHPKNPNYIGTSIDGERPPCIVNVHGGPTGFSAQSLHWTKQYFTSRGWAWLDVNYRGSSGYGKEYVERLQGKWGVVDVEDCIIAAKTLSKDPYNLVDPKRTVIRGGSAGGYTVLCALSLASDVKAFAAGTSLYGISNLEMLVNFTHKFESRYMEHLVGGNIKDMPEVYWKRSPIHHASNFVTPLLLLQGEVDRVVPKEQAEAIYNSIKARGGDAEYKLYAGEGHGWRQEQNMRDAIERELAFYQRILHLKGS